MGEAPSGDVADVDDTVAQIDLEIGVVLLDERRCGDACADHGINDRVRAARGLLHQNGRPGGQSAEHEAAASGRDFGIFNGRLAGVFDQQSGDLLDRLVAAVLKIAAAVAAGGENRQTLSGDGLPVRLRLKARNGRKLPGGVGGRLRRGGRDAGRLRGARAEQQTEQQKRDGYQFPHMVRAFLF